MSEPKTVFKFMRVICKMVSAIMTLLIIPSVANAQHGAELLKQPRALASTVNVESGLIEPAQVIAMARQTFPNKSKGLTDSELFRWIQSDPNHIGQLRGRLEEKDFFTRNPSWNPVKSKIASQNDGWRWVNGVVDGQKEGVQVKVRSNWKDYYREMQKDHKAEYFAIPDDQFDLVYNDLETRRLGAIRGRQTAKAERYAIDQQRLRKLGRTFEQLDRSIQATAVELSNPSRSVGPKALHEAEKLEKRGAKLGKIRRRLGVLDDAVTETAAAEETAAVATEAASAEETAAVAATEGAEAVGEFALGDFIAEGGWLLLLCW